MTRPWELRLGRWQDVLADVEMVDAVITDPPYSARVHDGHDAAVRVTRGSTSGGTYKKRGWVKPGSRPPGTVRPRRELSYSSWSSDDVEAFVSAWAPRCRGWFVALSDSDLAPVWRRSFESNGLTGFHPLPILMRGMSVRLAGDGPSSWAVYANVARPKALSKWGTLPGGYCGAPSHVKPSDRGLAIGGKPLWLMQELLRDYTRPGDLVCDPCAGGATTLLAASIEGRRSIGAEMDPETYAKARKRLEAGYTPTFDFGEEAAR